MKTKFTYNNKMSVRTLTRALLGILMIFALDAKPQSYCNSSYAGQYEHITNVTFAGINNNTGNGSGGPGNYTSLTATVIIGNTYNVSITGYDTQSYNEWYQVWIDWNQNGILNDAGEYYYVGFSGTLPYTISTSVAVPANALPGVTRMRVMMTGNNNYGNNPCAGFTYGEVEDYSVDVIELPCSGVNTPTLTAPGASTVCQGMPVTINAGGPSYSLGIEYQWQQSSSVSGPFTNVGTASTLLPASIPSASTGTAYYMLVATCTISSATATSNIISLTGAPVPAVPTISASPLGGCVGNTVTLSAQSSTGTTYTWHGPNGFTSAVQNPGITNAPAAATGVYSVVANQYNCSSQPATVSVTVSANPTIAVVASQNQFCVGGTPVTMTVNTNATTYTWSEGSSTTQIISVTPSVTTGYSVAVQNAFGCTSQAHNTITATNATLSVLGDWSCNNGIGGSGTLTAQAFTPSTVYWYASPTATSPIASGIPDTLGLATFTINHSYSDSTIYVLANFGVCSSTLLPITLTVSPQPTITLVSFPALNMSAPTITVCSNDTYTFTASGAGTYGWSNGVTSVATNSMLIVPGTYTFFNNPNNYTISVASADGCTASKAISLFVNTSPVVTASTFTNSVCPGTSVTIFAFGNASTYTWSANANNSNIPSVVVSPAQSTVYTVVGTAVNGCTTAASQSITVYAPPTLTLASLKPTICAGESVSLTANGAITYTWTSSTNNNLELQGSSAFVTPTISTNYQVTGADVHGCVSTATLAQAVSICSGIQQISGNNTSIKVYPNPATAEFIVELNNGAEKTIELIDLTGRVVMTGTSGEDTATINISQFANGVYYLKVKSNNTVEVVKIVKQ